MKDTDGGGEKYGLRPKNSGLNVPVMGRVADAKPYMKHHDIVVLARVPESHPKFERSKRKYEGADRSTIESQAHDSKSE